MMSALSRKKTASRPVNSLVSRLSGICGQLTLAQESSAETTSATTVVTLDSDFASTAGSKMLQDYRSPFDATVVTRLAEAGMVAQSLDTKAEVTLDKVDDGFSITAVHLTVEAVIPGASAQAFEEAARKAEKGCPVSKVLNAEITMDFTLA